jgi:predicted Fe-Mo cluster-binding NifX family protein
MTQGIVALPSNNPGGLDAELAAHFGHCDLYTLVTLDEQGVKEVAVLPGVDHQQGGCMAPVQYLASHGVKAMIAGGMGLRPLMGFNQMGIEVFYGGNQPTSVGLAVAALSQGLLQRFSQNHTCGGGGTPAQDGR